MTDSFGNAPGLDSRVLAVVLQIEESLGHPWTVEAMAARAELSVSRFAHRFREAVGEAPLEYLGRLRLERAALQLRYADWPVTDIGLAAGYHSPAGFSHAFAARFGSSPTRFRERNRAAPFLRQVPRAGQAPTRHAGPMPTCGGAHVRVVPQPAFRVAFFRQWGGLLPFPRVWFRLAAWADRRRLVGLHACPIGMHFDEFGITPLDRVRYDAGLIVPPDFVPEPADEVLVRDVSAGLVAQLPFRGTIVGLSQTWSWLATVWLAPSGYQPRTLYAYDLHAAALLGHSRLSLAARLSLDVRSTLCLPVLPGDAEPAAVWTGHDGPG